MVSARNAGSRELHRKSSSFRRDRLWALRWQRGGNVGGRAGNDGADRPDLPIAGARMFRPYKHRGIRSVRVFFRAVCLLCVADWNNRCHAHWIRINRCTRSSGAALRTVSRPGEQRRYLAFFHLLGRGLKVFVEGSRFPVQRSPNQIISPTTVETQVCSTELWTWIIRFEL
jgi:hypothetical protein